MINFGKFFLPEHEYFLENISYQRIEGDITSGQLSLNISDHIEANWIAEDQLKFIFTRSLSFDEEKLYRLSVSFGAILTLNTGLKQEINYGEIDWAQELHDHGEAFLGNLVSRASLQIAEITASFGQTPIVTPPTVI